jgi:MoaA/NifB/PqqE/SkfB family radical SAM enzyme
MPLDEFQRLVRKYRRRFDCLGLADFGEPLIHPQFVQIVRECHDCGVRYNITTNAQYMPDEVLRALHKYPPQDINVSLYATEQAAYESIFPGGDVSKTLHNVFMLLRYKAPQTTVTLRSLDIPSLRGQGHNIMALFPHCQYDFDNWLDSWAGRIDISAFDTDCQRHVARSAHCRQPWWHCWINSSGGIMQCNVLDEPIGHIDDGLRNVWNGQAYREVRMNSLAGKRVGRCAGCNYRNAMTGW